MGSACMLLAEDHRGIAVAAAVGIFSLAVFDHPMLKLFYNDVIEGVLISLPWYSILIYHRRAKLAARALSGWGIWVL